MPVGKIQATANPLRTHIESTLCRLLQTHSTCCCSPKQILSQWTTNTLIHGMMIDSMYHSNPQFPTAHPCPPSILIYCIAPSMHASFFAALCTLCTLNPNLLHCTLNACLFSNCTLHPLHPQSPFAALHPHCNPPSSPASLSGICRATDRMNNSAVLVQQQSKQSEAPIEWGRCCNTLQTLIHHGLNMAPINFVHQACLSEQLFLFLRLTTNKVKMSLNRRCSPLLFLFYV